jgi:hypothetical protein
MMFGIAYPDSLRVGWILADIVVLMCAEMKKALADCSARAFFVLIRYER